MLLLRITGPNVLNNMPNNVLHVSTLGPKFWNSPQTNKTSNVTKQLYSDVPKG